MNCGSICPMATNKWFRSVISCTAVPLYNYYVKPIRNKLIMISHLHVLINHFGSSQCIYRHSEVKTLNSHGVINGPPYYTGMYEYQSNVNIMMLVGGSQDQSRHLSFNWDPENLSLTDRMPRLQFYESAPPTQIYYDVNSYFFNDRNSHKMLLWYFWCLFGRRQWSMIHGLLFV